MESPKYGDSSSLTSPMISSQQIICAVSVSRGVTPTVGLAFLNSVTNEVVLCQINDGQTFVRTVLKTSVFEPSCILVQSLDSPIVSILQHEVEPPILFWDRKHWAESTGLDLIQQLAFKANISGLKSAIRDNYFATCCFAAVVTFFTSKSGVTFVNHSLRIKYEPSEGAMMIDRSTVKTLELIQNLENSKSKDCLFGLINHTLTPTGSRLLRNHILQPLIDVETLNVRLDALEEMTSKDEIFVSTRQALKQFQDTDKLLSNLIRIPGKPSLHMTELEINDVLVLKSFVISTAVAYEALRGAESVLLVRIRDLCNSKAVEQVKILIDGAINEDATYQSRPIDLTNQRTYAVKSGVNGLLDIARSTMETVRQDLLVTVAEMREEFDLAMDLKYDSSRNFYLRSPAAEFDVQSVPNTFINIVRRRDKVEYQTVLILQLNQKMSDSRNEAVMMSDRIIKDLIEDIRKEVPALFQVSEGLAMLDMVASFAQLATIQDYVRPEFTDTVAVKSGRHPIGEKLYTFIANDFYATANNHFQIVTGPNMSGKSTYIRSLALLTIMSQIGSFVPAEYASLPIRHQLFARLSLDDSSEASISTFSLEMQEMAFILANITQRSLVIIDELGRGTSTRDGLAVALSIAEALVQSKAMVWFATHFREIAQILEPRIGVGCSHFQTEAGQVLKIPFKVSDGYVDDTNYGIVLARTFPFPPQVTDTAEAVSSHLREQIARRNQESKATTLARRRKLIIELHEQLIQARDGILDGKELAIWLKRLQTDFVHRMIRLFPEKEELRSLSLME
ncbi:MAG: MutS protein msh4 [Vezdaea aestivalis]|nr:MAG: MutS protein msh4 [Vezdaea aestivalis]